MTAAHAQLFELSQVNKKFHEIAKTASSYFMQDFQHVIQLNFRALQFKTVHPSAFNSNPSNSTPALNIDTNQIIMTCKSINDNYIEYLPLTDSLVFPQALDSVCELSITLPLTRSHARNHRQNSGDTVILPPISERVYRFDLGDVEGRHYTLEHDCCLIYTLTKQSNITYKSIVKNNSIISLPVSNTVYIVAIEKLRVHQHLFDSMQVYSELKLDLLNGRVGPNVDLNVNHELVLAYLHEPTLCNIDETEINTMCEIIGMFNGLADKRSLLVAAMKDRQVSENVYGIPEFKRFILQSSPIRFSHNQDIPRGCVVMEHKVVVVWGGVQSIVTTAMVPAQAVGVRESIQQLINHYLAS